MKFRCSALALVCTLLLGPDLRAQSVELTPPVTLSIASRPWFVLGCKDFLAHAVSMGAPYTQTRFRIIAGLADPHGVSFESEGFPGHFLRQQNFAVKLHPFPEHDEQFRADATFFICECPDNKKGVRYRSFSYPDCYLAVTRDNAIFLVPNAKDEDSIFLVR